MKKRILILLAALASLAIPAARAQGVGEADLKAAFLLNFARYIQWPADAFTGADAPLTISVVGNAQVATVLSALVSGERAGSHPIAVQQSATKGCHIVFVGGSGSPEAFAGRACLTVGDSEDFLRRGGAIRFFTGADRKMRYEINPRAIERARLKPSGTIMRLARIATDGR